MEDAIIAATSGNESANQLRSGDDLSGVARGMFGGVEHQTEHRRRQLLPADHAGLEKRRTRCGRESLERLPHHVVPRRDEIRKGGPLRRQPALTRQCFPLRLRERFASCIREQAIGAAGQMREMKAYRGDPARLTPQLIGSQTDGRSFDVLARHDERVRSGLKQRRNLWNGPT